MRVSNDVIFIFNNPTNCIKPFRTPLELHSYALAMTHLVFVVQSVCIYVYVCPEMSRSGDLITEVILTLTCFPADLLGVIT